MKGFWPILALVFLLAGCESTGMAPIHESGKPAAAQYRRTVAPIVDAQTPAQYVVQKGDTLFAIAFQYGLDYRDVADWNNLASADVIYVGQSLRLTPPEKPVAQQKPVARTSLQQEASKVETMPDAVSPAPLVRPLPEPPLLTEPKALRLPYSDANWAAVKSPVTNTPVVPALKSVAPAALPAAVPNPVPAPPPLPQAAQSSAPENADEAWSWPANGKLTDTFGQGGGKGINIGGDRSSPIIAAASGKVVYSGAGLRGYGKMLIIKHADEYLSAYAHNQNLLVKEGDWVKRGQKIAEMGDTDSDRVELHFEIRQYGKPVDPLKLLPERK